MADREEFLAQHTFSDQGMSTAQRVYETLAQDPSLSQKRSMQLLALLVEALEQQELLDASVVDDMLISITR